MSFLSARQATGRRSRRTTSTSAFADHVLGEVPAIFRVAVQPGQPGHRPSSRRSERSGHGIGISAGGHVDSITGMIAPASTATSPTTAGQSHPRGAPTPSAASSEWRHSRPCTHSGIRALPRKRLRSVSARLVEVKEVEAPAIRGRSARARSAAFGAPPRGGTRPGTRGRRVPAARRRRASRRGS
jgi:hypothetical protein